MQKNKSGSVFGGALMISGLSIGAGMLALPVMTGRGGFIPAVTIYLLSWLFMTATGLLLAEACVAQKKNVNLITLTQEHLGSLAKVICWFVYLFLFYSLVVAYLTAGRKLLPANLEHWHPGMQMLLFVLILSPFVYIGARAIDKINRLLMVGMLASYAAFLFLAAPHVQVGRLATVDFSPALYAFPVSLLSFGYQGSVPSLARYMEWDGKKIRKAIYLGTLITLIVYILWGAVLLGVIPAEGENSLQELFQSGGSVVEPLGKVIGKGWANSMSTAFAFFAIVTSFLGVCLGLRDFLIDGLGISRNWKGRLASMLLVLIPPFCVALIDPAIFLKALHYGGGLGGAILLGVFPVLIAWNSSRGQSNYPKLVVGGKLFLLFLLLVFIVDIVLDLRLTFS